METKSKIKPPFSRTEEHKQFNLTLNAYIESTPSGLAAVIYRDIGIEVESKRVYFFNEKDAVKALKAWENSGVIEGVSWKTIRAKVAGQ
jgi:hypothetical protein